MYLTTELIHALPSSERRVFSREEAASYVGVSIGKFSSLVAEGLMPSALPIGGVKRWDKAALDLYLDRMSGLARPASSEPTSAYDTWKGTHGQG